MKKPFALALTLLAAAPAQAAKTRLALAPGAHPSGHRVLSDDSSAIPAHIDHLVIGSGYGASVAALRLAQALDPSGTGAARGKVAVFERGKEWQPGDFPQDLVSLIGELRGPLNPLGLLDSNTSMRADMDVIGANALGGTSQLNAAITLRAADIVWSRPEWPRAVREAFQSGDLARFYERAEGMLLPVVGPRTHLTPKTRAHLGNFPAGFPKGMLTLNINHEEGRERFGVTQAACTNCGNCCGGCNVGAKNTLNTNYLPCAKDHGAAIYTQVEVDYLEKLPNLGAHRPRWLVHYTVYAKSMGMVSRQRRMVTANNVFLGAGSAGTTKILMKSQRDGGLALSRALGSRASANGDVLGYVFNGKGHTRIAPFEDSAMPADSAASEVGQTITAYGDFRAANASGPIEHQFVLLDGAVPRPFVYEAFKGLATAMSASQLKSFSATSRIGKDLDLFCTYPSQGGAFNHSMVLLACGYDSSGGRYELNGDDGIHVVWPGVKNEESFRYIREQMRAYAQRMGGRFIDNPRSHFPGAGGKMQATHPLGGAPMGESAATGVVNDRGEVFDPAGDIHGGLHVVDAAAIPTALLAPPLITITALAERSMEHFVEKHFCALHLAEASGKEPGE